MSTQIQITPKTGITVGTTAITSGTDGRVFFQAGGVVQQDAAFFWDNTNKRLGVGATPASTVRLDVRAQGALSTDIAFRVRNSADTANLVTIQGNGNTLFNNTTHGLLFNSQALGNNQLELYSYGTTSVIINPVVSRFAFTGLTPVKGVVIGNSSTAPVALLDVWDFAGPGPGTTVARFGSQHNNAGADNLNILFSTRYSGFTAGSAHLGRLNVGQTGSGASINARSYFKFELIRNNTLAERASITSQSNLLLQTPTEDTNDIGVIYIPNGTAPTGSITDGFKQYSADITAGNAAPHFRTENGSIVKLYQETAVTTSQGIATALASQGLLATSTIVPTVQSVVTAATVTPVAGNEEVVITAQAADFTIANPTGTWYQGQDLIIRIKDDGTGRAITWDSDYRAIGVTLPTTTVANKLTYVGIIYNSTDSKWDILGVSQEA
jgi:hypothetical protein